MKIELAEHSGFCMGVRNAILRIVNEINTSEEEIYVYGPLIHNPQTLDVLGNRGVRTIYSLEGIEGRQIAIRTHGIPVEEYRQIKERSSRVINLTCPRVARVQSIIKKYSEQGYFTIITGDRDHAEVAGLKSYASSGVHVVTEIKDLETLPHAEKYVLVSQTTFDRRLFREFVSELTGKISEIEVIDTICDSTRDRQGSVMKGIGNRIDTLVVAGGKNSANTNRLAQIGRDSGIKTFHIEREDELLDSDFSDSSNVLVTAGASTPGWIINNVLERLYRIKYRKMNFFINAVKIFLEFVVRTNLLSAVTASFITLLAGKFMGAGTDTAAALISFLYIFSMYSVNNYFDREFLRESNSYKYAIYERFGVPLMAVSILFMGLCMWLSLRYTGLTQLMLFLSFLFGFSYLSGPVKKLVKSMGSPFIRRAYNSKVITSFGWLIVTVALPAMNSSPGPVGLAAVTVMVFSLIFLRHVLIDIIMLQGDLIMGRESLPILIGNSRIYTLSYVTGTVSALVFAAAAVMTGQLPFLLLVLPLAYYMGLAAWIKKLKYLVSLKYEILTDLNLCLVIAIYCVLASM